MSLHETTFEYLQPSGEQIDRMNLARDAADRYAATIDHILPAGADKTYVLRKLRTVAMWVNVAITRKEDGSPRE